MPVTACFACSVVLAGILLIPVLPISLILFDGGRKRAALTLLGLPVGMIVLSALSTIAVLVMMWHYGVSLSRDPVRLFERTFGFEPPPRTEVLAAYAELGMD